VSGEKTVHVYTLAPDNGKYAEAAPASRTTPLSYAIISKIQNNANGALYRRKRVQR
jgi:hypothetical protein